MGPWSNKIGCLNALINRNMHYWQLIRKGKVVVNVGSMLLKTVPMTSWLLSWIHNWKIRVMPCSCVISCSVMICDLSQNCSCSSTLMAPIVQFSMFMCQCSNTIHCWRGRVMNSLLIFKISQFMGTSNNGGDQKIPRNKGTSAVVIAMQGVEQWMLNWIN